MEEFDLFTANDRRDVSYAACLGGTTLVGAAVGRFGMLPGLLAGAAAGLVVGLVTCKRLSPTIERKLFSTSERFSEGEILAVLRIIRDQTGVQTKSDAMYLLARARVAAAAGGTKSHVLPAACLAPRVAASQLLSSRV